jgi:hypothetical protein
VLPLPSRLIQRPFHCLAQRSPTEVSSNMAESRCGSRVGASRRDRRSCSKTLPDGTNTPARGRRVPNGPCWAAKPNAAAVPRLPMASRICSAPGIDFGTSPQPKGACYEV